MKISIKDLLIGSFGELGWYDMVIIIVIVNIICAIKPIYMHLFASALP